jgi:glutaminase
VLLQSYGRIYCDPTEAVDLYTRQCSLLVSARDVAVMGATLADGGVSPVTGERVVTRLESNTPVAYSAIAAPSATISGGKRFHTNITTTTASTENVIALSLIALAPPSRGPGHLRSEGDSNGDVAPPRL